MNILTAEDVIKQLKLIPLTPEGGFFGQKWLTDYGTSIYYLITPDSYSSLHKLDLVEIWHFYAGDPVRQLQLHPDGTAGVYEISSKLEDGIEPQLLSPAGSWQATKLIAGGKWALLGTTMAPPYTENCITYPVIENLFKQYDEQIDLIKEFL